MELLPIILDTVLHYMGTRQLLDQIVMTTKDKIQVLKYVLSLNKVTDKIASMTGSAYFFISSNGGTTWSQSYKVVASDGGSSNYFGWKLSIANNFAIMGSDEDDDKGTNSGVQFEQVMLFTSF